MNHRLSCSIVAGICAVLGSVALAAPASAAPAPDTGNATFAESAGPARVMSREISLGRVLDHTEIVCFPCRPRHYYNYISLVASDDVPQEIWDRLAQYGECVKGSMSIESIFAMVGGNFSSGLSGCAQASAEDLLNTHIETHIGR